MRFEEHIFCTRFPDITGYGDIDHERFEDYIFVGYHYIVSGSLVELGSLLVHREHDEATTYRSITISCSVSETALYLDFWEVRLPCEL